MPIARVLLPAFLVSILVSFCGCVVPGPTYDTIGATHDLAAGTVITDADISIGKVRTFRHIEHGYRVRLEMNFPTERSQVVGHTLLVPIPAKRMIYSADISQ